MCLLTRGINALVLARRAIDAEAEEIFSDTAVVCCVGRRGDEMCTIFIRTILIMALFLASAGSVDAQGNEPIQTSSAEDQLLLIFPDRTAEEFIGTWSTSFPREGGARTDSSRYEGLVNPGVLADALGDFLNNLQPILDRATSITGEYALDQIEINVGINGSGKVGIIMSGTVGAEVGLKLVLRQSDQ